MSPSPRDTALPLIIMVEEQKRRSMFILVMLQQIGVLIGVYFGMTSGRLILIVLGTNILWLLDRTLRIRYAKQRLRAFSQAGYNMRVVLGSDAEEPKNE